MVRMIDNRKLALYERCDAFTRPDIAREPKGGGSLRQQRQQLRFLLRCQAWSGSRRFSSAERCNPVGANSTQYLTDSALCEAERIGNRLLFPAFLMQFKDAKAADLAPIGGVRRECGFHNRLIPHCLTPY